MITLFHLTYKFINNDSLNKKLGDRNIYGIISMICLFIVFIMFTVNPPKLPIFLDPVTQTYGIFKITE